MTLSAKRRKVVVGCKPAGLPLRSRPHIVCCPERRLAPGRHCCKQGFALVITLSLLALLVLAVCALSALLRLNVQIATTSVQQTQARQNALLGLSAALAVLQKYAGPDGRVTAMAGVTGVAAASASPTRHWCGVWTEAGDFVGWLASGAVPGPAAAIQPGLHKIALVDAGSVGAVAVNSEHVEVGKLALSSIDSLTALPSTAGNYAWWAGDEGVKVSAYAPAAELALAGVCPVLGSNPSTSATARLRAALTTYAVRLPRIVSYEQLSLLPIPSASALTPSVLQDSFHHTTLTAYRLTPAGPGVARKSGMLNLNTDSAIVWRGILETYNTISAGPPIAAIALGTSITTSLPGRISAGLADAVASGKEANGPFTTVDGFANSALLSNALFASGSGVTPEELMAGIGPMLTTRSDTFRIRACGEAPNPVDADRAEAVAFCEAIVQRIPAPAPNGEGRRLAIIYFRWLGPDDV